MFLIQNFAKNWIFNILTDLILVPGIATVLQVDMLIDYIIK